MKKITGIILALSMLMMSAGCGDNSSEKENSSSSVDLQTTSEAEAENTSETEEVSQTESTEELPTEEIETKQIATEEITTEQIKTEENTTKASEPKNETEFLSVDKKLLYDNEWSDKYSITLAEIECSSVLLGDEDAKRYPKLAKALTENADFYEVNMLGEYDMNIESAEGILSSGAEGFSPLVSTLDVHVRRADNTVLSVLYDSYYYNGMNDGSRSFWGGNYDTKTGKEIYLPNVVTDMEEFAKVVEAQLFSDFGADVFYSDTIIEEYFKEYGADGTHWIMEYNGVTVYFDDGEIAGSGVGDISVTVEFAEYPELFKKKYTAVPEAYIVGIPMKSTFYTDLDDDGSCEELTIADSYEGDFGLDRTLSLRISTLETDYTEKLPANGCEAYYVKTVNARNYLYVLVELESQTELYTFQITNTAINKIGKQSISPYYSVETVSVLTDPDNMHFDIFGNADVEPVGDDFFTVGYDGMPVMK